MKKILAFLALALAASAASCSPAEAASLGQLEHAHQAIFNQPSPGPAGVQFSYPSSSGPDAAMLSLYDTITTTTDLAFAVQYWLACKTPDGGRILTGYGSAGKPLSWSGLVKRGQDGSWQAIFLNQDAPECTADSKDLYLAWYAGRHFK
jgi:hypothetical protein